MSAEVMTKPRFVIHMRQPLLCTTAPHPHPPPDTVHPPSRSHTTTPPHSPHLHAPRPCPRYTTFVFDTSPIRRKPRFGAAMPCSRDS
ncbi:uncharacterized protein M421DRAFT_201052 [Didymella exigua CBS 183.55]|uniref:Uncharacterized protein n=1 Tax=Didymella exigua CBS 183.55 TaxID=1150837 RepID=A0A6A5S1E4_9PLEO|nr:uncharacterized protein M421DRAFT_201052 [Didymella exigua CBS 183.55]KAF1933609.1 hypothetical protein M421DRAFT_201052 [Didymella exigua CBS 183.55]